MSNYISIQSLYQTDSVREGETLEQIRLKNNLEGQITGLWYYNETFFLYHLHDKDYHGAKLNAYRCGCIDEFLITHYDSKILDSGVKNLTYVLLSDNKRLIDRFADLAHSNYNWMVEQGYSTLLYCIQQIMKGDWERVKWSIEIMNTKNPKLQKGILSDILFFEGMIDKDESKMCLAIKQLLKDHKKRNRYMGISEQYVSIPALTYLKLAWLKGFEIQIDHPLIAKELLPYHPLDEYDGKYDFLNS